MIAGIVLFYQPDLWIKVFFSLDAVSFMVYKTNSPGNHDDQPGLFVLIGKTLATAI